ncbi:MAG TPA: heme-binding protein [Rhizomicrobium sp.]|nr:heme-binding protein [Rhizomicrobium sp.]
MRKPLTLALLLPICVCGPAFAQMNPAPTIAASPTADEMKMPRPARARGIPVALAIEGAVAANAQCLANTYKTTALITDSAGVPIVMISNDGAAAITQRIAMSKVQAVLKYKMTSGEVADKAKTDPALAAEIKANPMIETARQGAVPLMAGDEMIGVFAASGAPGGDKDEVCVHAGIAKIADRIK